MQRYWTKRFQVLDKAKKVVLVLCYFKIRDLRGKNRNSLKSDILKTSFILKSIIDKNFRIKI